MNEGDPPKQSLVSFRTRTKFLDWNLWKKSGSWNIRVVEVEQELTNGGNVVALVKIKYPCILVTTVALEDDPPAWKVDLPLNFLLTLSRDSLSNFFFLWATSFR